MSRKPNPRIVALAHTIHLRLRELEGGGRIVEVPRAMEAILVNDPSYVPRHRGVRPATNPSIRLVEDVSRALHTTVGALLGEEPHPPVYTGPPSEAENERRAIHREGGGSATPFTVLVFPSDSEAKIMAMIAEYPFMYTVGDTEEEALELMREALDFLLIDAYEHTLEKIKERGRPFRQAPFAFQPPGKGRTR